MKKFLMAFMLMLPAITTMAEDGNEGGVKINKLEFETRLGWEGERVDKDMVHANTGFKGQYFNMRFDGQITKGLTFSYRQRLVKPTSGTFWDATDWVHLDWKINKRWGLSAGKQVVAIGGYEYDRAPIDLYYCSEFWNNIPCYQLGISGTYNPTKHDQLLLQVCNSPLRPWAGNNTYGINLVWYGQHGWWETIWSVNAMQYTRSRWMNYIALGNRFLLGDGWRLDVDLMNRAADGQKFLLKDFSVMSELSVQASKASRAYIKYTYDQNESGTQADRTVLDGTQLHLVGVGVEVQPLKKYRDALRLFAAGGYSWGTNTNADGALRDKMMHAEAGVKFKMDFLEGLKKVVVSCKL